MEDGSIKITIVDQYGSKSQDTSAEQASEMATGQETATSAASSSRGDSKIGNIIMNRAFSIAKDAVISVADYEITKYFSRRDDYINMRNYGIAKTMISNGISLGTTVIGGYVMGGGGITGIAVAAVAAIGWGVARGVQVYQALDQQNFQLAQAGAQLSYERQRAGYSLTAGSIGEGL